MPLDNRDYYREGPYQPYQPGPKSIVTVLIIINVTVFLVDAFTSPVQLGGQSLQSNWVSWLMGLKIDGQGLFQEVGVPFWQLPPWNVWQIFTYGFAHASINASPSGIWHVGMNMLILFMLGRPVEDRYGRDEFLKFYLLALLFAGACSYLFILLTSQTSILVGASGAVTAVVMLAVFNFPREKVLLMGVFPMPLWALGVLLVVGDLLSAFNASSRIGWYAHLSGALFAFLYFRYRWNFSRLKLDFLRDWFSNKPKLRVHRPSSPVTDKLQSDADRILEKLHQQGEASLTRKERKTLEEYSRKVRQRRQ